MGYYNAVIFKGAEQPFFAIQRKVEVRSREIIQGELEGWKSRMPTKEKRMTTQTYQQLIIEGIIIIEGIKGLPLFRTDRGARAESLSRKAIEHFA